MKKTILGFSVIVFGLLFTSCQKDDYIPETPSLTDINEIKNAIEASPWIFKNSAVVYSPDAVETGPTEPCKDDDLYTFQLNGNAEVVYGPNNCGFYSAEINGKYASWELDPNGQTLKMVYSRDMPGGYLAGDVIVWRVDYITTKKLVIKRLVTEPGKSYTLVDTYKRN